MLENGKQAEDVKSLIGIWWGAYILDHITKLTGSHSEYALITTITCIFQAPKLKNEATLQLILGINSTTEGKKGRSFLLIFQISFV